MTSDDECLYMSATGSHRPPKRRKPNSRMRAQELDATTAFDQEHTDTPEKRSHRPPAACKKVTTTASSVAAASRTLVRNRYMHLRTVRKRNVRLRSSGATVAMAAVSHIYMVNPVSTLHDVQIAQILNLEGRVRGIMHQKFGKLCATILKIMHTLFANYENLHWLCITHIWHSIMKRTF